MGKRHPNTKRVKFHRSYTLQEAAALLSVHPNTLRNWIADGLEIVHGHWPILIAGEEIHRFTKLRKQESKVPCGNSFLFCLRCRKPRRPIDRTVSCNVHTPTKATLSGECSSCGLLMHKWINPSAVNAARWLQIAHEPAKAIIDQTQRRFKNNKVVRRRRVKRDA